MKFQTEGGGQLFRKFGYVKKIICKNLAQRPEKYSFREKKKTNKKIVFIPKRCKKKEGKVCKKQKSVQKTKISAKSWKKGFCDKFQGFKLWRFSGSAWLPSNKHQKCDF